LAVSARLPGQEFFQKDLRRATAAVVVMIRRFRRMHRESQAKIAQLRRENQDLRTRNRRLVISLRDSLGVKPAPPAEPPPAAKPPERRPRGAPQGHRGNTRKVPDRWDEHRTVPPPAVCTCGYTQVLDAGACDRRFVEDIPPVSRRVTLVEYRRGVCARCGRELRHPEATGPPVSVGPNLAAHLTMLRQAGVTYRKLSAFCAETLGIPLTPSGAMGLANRTVDGQRPLYETIGNVLARQATVHGDETGWKVRGKPWFVWIFCNREMAYYLPDRRRSGEVPAEVLGRDYPGTVVCDFLGAYNEFQTQRCLVHFARDIRKEREALPGSVWLARFEAAFWSCVARGEAVAKMVPGPDKDTALRGLDQELRRVARMPVTKGRGETLRKRIVNYHDQMLRFAAVPGLDWHNNRAERQLRPLVIARKMSFGSDTPEGARRTCLLHSVAETCRLQHIRPVDLLREGLDKARRDGAPLTRLLTTKLYG
jgi:transposase